MWDAPLPSAPPKAGRVSRLGHQAARVAVVTGKTVATPITVVADAVGGAASAEELWNAVGHVLAIGWGQGGHRQPVYPDFTR